MSIIGFRETYDYREHMPAFPSECRVQTNQKEKNVLTRFQGHWGALDLLHDLALCRYTDFDMILSHPSSPASTNAFPLTPFLSGGARGLRCWGKPGSDERWRF